MSDYTVSPFNPNTRMKNVNGMVMDKRGMRKTDICVRVTSDRRGKSLSLEDGKTMLMIPLETVEDMIEVVE